MPNRPAPASLPRAPDVAPALVGLGVAAAKAVDCDGVVFEPEIADDSRGDDNAVAGVLAMRVEEEEEGEGALVLVASAVALMLRVTPTGLQIDCAKAMTSVEREGYLG